MLTLRNLKIIIGLILGFVTLVIISLYIWSLQIEKSISERLKKGWFKAPIEFYSQQDVFSKNKIIKPSQVEKSFLLRGYKKANKNYLKSSEYLWWTAPDCQMSLSEKLPEETQKCFIFRDKTSQELKLMAFSKSNKILSNYQGEPLEAIDETSLPPHLFAQYYGDQPILRQVLSLPDIPLYCSQAVTAIEDKNFLIHKGFSPLGFVRAAIKNLTSGYYAQGGSTITQQLVKNYFLSSEKTIKRKISEIVMSLVLETKFSKEQILENYLNVIYMGQNGPFQVRGFGAASIHYLNKNINDLNLSECALLAAVLNNPGRYNPFRNPDKAKERRAKVLKHMLEQNMIDQNQYETAHEYSLPNAENRMVIESAPYYVDAVFKKLKEMNFLPHYSEEGLKVYTYLQLDMQKNARLAIKNGIENLEQHNKKINALKKQGEVLQGLLIHIDLESGGIVSLVGGKDFRVSQFNRAVDSRRQVGSIFKPLVYLSALESQTPSGKPYSPLTMISDEPFIYKYEGQTWQPQNYEKKFNGIIPMYYALKNSINVATARLGVNIGLEHIIDVARRMGMHSEILPVPALTLGAFEMQPFEVAKIYSGIARMGSVPDLNIINKIKSHSGDLLYESELNDKLQVSPEKVAQLVGMLKQTLNSGTARLAKRLGFNKVAAGKTGTTSDTKDAWFVGFTPKDLTITWVGYDNNISSELTGASGALPIWVDYMKKSTSFYEDQDFNWPPGVQKKVITLEENLDWLKDPNADEKLPFELIVE